METKTELVPKYKVGDRVKIWPVEKMQYLSSKNRIRAGWSSQMEEFCGQSYVISSIELSKRNGFFKYQFLNMPASMNLWVWSEDMFDLDIPQEEIEKQENEFLELIGF